MCDHMMMSGFAGGLILHDTGTSTTRMNESDFVERFGAVYEHSPWVARDVFAGGIESVLADADALSARFEAVFIASGHKRQLAILRAHPELACGSAKEDQLSADSDREQRGAGLDQCSDVELHQFRDMNNKYMIKNNFPFIVAVKGRTRQQILKVFQQRLDNDPDSEFETALRQVCQIGRFRIGGILDV